jgi:hypothetical protein
MRTDNSFLSLYRSNLNAGAIRHLLNNVECVRGSYSVTLSFLDLLANLLAYIQRWRHDDIDVSLQDFHPYLTYVRTDLFTDYESWKYTQIIDRWQMAIKILHIFNEILRNDERTVSSHIQHSFNELRLLFQEKKRSEDCEMRFSH